MKKKDILIAFLIFFPTAGFILYMGGKLGTFIGLGLMYGFDKIWANEIYVVQGKPKILLSNGDDVTWSILPFVTFAFIILIGYLVLKLYQFIGKKYFPEFYRNFNKENHNEENSLDSLQSPSD